MAVDNWNLILEKIREQVPGDSFNTWFGSVRLVRLEADKLELSVKNSLVKRWIERNYTDTIVSAVAPFTSPELSLSITVDSTETCDDDSETAGRATMQTASGQALPVSVNSAPGPQNLSGINPKNTLENFVAGSCNRISLAAAKRSVENPGEYSPLFIHAGHGLGKTHLMHGIYLSAVNSPRKLKTIFLTAESFVNSYTAAHSERSVPQFRQRFRGCDILIIDDLQTLLVGNKTATLEELKNTLDTLANAGKQVVISCDRPPEMLAALPEGLRERLAGGLRLQLSGIDAETKTALIHHKALERGIELTPELAECVSEHVGGSVREIVGAIGKLSAVRDLGGMKLTPGAVKAALGVRCGIVRPQPTLQDIAQNVCREYHVTVDDITGRKRKATVRKARQLGMLLSRKLTSHSLSEIGEFYGNRNHATVSICLKSAPGLVDEDGRATRKVENILLEMGFAANAREIFKSQGTLF